LEYNQLLILESVLQRFSHVNLNCRQISDKLLLLYVLQMVLILRKKYICLLQYYNMLRSYIIIHIKISAKKKSFISFKKIEIKTDFDEAYFYLYFYLFSMSERDYTALISRLDN